MTFMTPDTPAPRKVYKVSPSGPLDAKIVLCGEAPGKTEIRTGEGFTGRAGHVLDKCLSLAYIPRSACRLTNVIKEYPPNGKASSFITFDKTGFAYPTPRFNDYVKELYGELRLLSANVYVAVGNIALYAMTGKSQITKWRGSILEGLWKEEAKVISVIHPAATLYGKRGDSDYGSKYLYTHYITNDLRRVKAEAEFPSIRLPARTIHTGKGFDFSMSYLSDCLGKREVGEDIEVIGEEISCISISKSPHDIISIPFCKGTHPWFTIDQEIEIWKLIAQINQDPNITKIGQALMFDCFMLWWKYGIHTHNVFDTMIGFGILYPEFPKGLDFITSIYTKEPYYKDDGKKWFRWGGKYEDLWVYNAKDSAVCHESKPRIIDELERMGNTEAYNIQVALVEPLLTMQARGIKVDTDGLLQAREDNIHETEGLQEELNAIVGRDINVKSFDQLSYYFYTEKKIKPYLKDGRPTCNETALKRIAKGTESRRAYPEANIMLKIVHLRTILKTFIEVKLDADNRLRCSFNPIGAADSGRLSSSKTIFKTGMNIQNQPEELRKYYLFDDGYMGYNMDLSQVENRIVAYTFPDYNMIAAFESGLDVHSHTAALIFNKPIEEISAEDGSSSIGGGLHSERFWGKKSNHAFNYDLGFRSAALQFEILERESKFIYDKYHTAYPGIHQGHAWIRAKLGQDRTLVNCLGRKRLFLEKWGDPLFKEAYSWIPQSTAVGIINRDGLNYVYYNQDLFHIIELLNQVHDSIVFQISLDYTWEEHAACILAIRKSLESPIEWQGRKFSIPCDLEAGLNMGKTHKETNPLGLVKVKYGESETVGRLAGRIREIYREFGTTPSIPSLDRNICNSSLPQA